MIYKLTFKSWTIEADSETKAKEIAINRIAKEKPLFDKLKINKNE